MSDLLDLDKISKEDTLSVAMSLLYSLKGVPQYSVISELPYILSYEDFIKFVKYYGGMTLRVPEISEINNLLKVILLYQYFKVYEMSWKDALAKSGFSENESISAKAKLQFFEKLIKSQEIGGRNYE